MVARAVLIQCSVTIFTPRKYSTRNKYPCCSLRPLVISSAIESPILYPYMTYFLLRLTTAWGLSGVRGCTWYSSTTTDDKVDSCCCSSHEQRYLPLDLFDGTIFSTGKENKTNAVRNETRKKKTKQPRRTHSRCRPMEQRKRSRTKSSANTWENSRASSTDRAPKKSGKKARKKRKSVSGKW